jgi:hypothetical protein
VLAPWRVLGAVLAVATLTGVVWLASNHEFDVDLTAVEISGVEFTSPQTVKTIVTLAAHAERPNAFRIDTGAIRRALVELPAIEEARVDVTLPDRLSVEVTERTPVFVLRSAAGDFLVDDGGFVLAIADMVSEEALLVLPSIDDRRVDFQPTPDLGIGGQVDEISLAADLRLAAVTPALLGTSYDRLALSIDDADGYVLTAEPNGWRAIFGHYTPTLRPVDLIDRQVECLRSKLAGGESDIETIYLAPLDDRCGTYLPRSTPGGVPDATASPAAAR